MQPGIRGETFELVFDKPFSRTDTPLKVRVGEDKITSVYKILKVKGYRRLIHTGYSHTVKIIE